MVYLWKFLPRPSWYVKPSLSTFSTTKYVQAEQPLSRFSLLGPLFETFVTH
jgi:hypothetical protein